MRSVAWISAFAGMTTALIPPLTLGEMAASEPLKNHYNDSFIQVTNGIKACRLPRGTFMTSNEARAEAHPRIERGTTCFRAGKCS